MCFHLYLFITVYLQLLQLRVIFLLCVSEILSKWPLGWSIYYIIKVSDGSHTCHMLSSSFTWSLNLNLYYLIISF